MILFRYVVLSWLCLIAVCFLKACVPRVLYGTGGEPPWQGHTVYGFGRREGGKKAVVTPSNPNLVS